AQCGISGSTILGKQVVLAGQGGLADHLTVGDGARGAAKAGVAEDISAGAAYSGIPARPMNEVFRQTAAIRGLPKMVGQLRELTKRIKELESAAHHQGSS